MDTGITATTLFDIHRERLRLRWPAGRTGGARTLMGGDADAAERSAFGEWIGRLNLILPNRIQVLGTAELNYLAAMRKNSHADAVRQLFDGSSACVVIADGEAVGAEFVRQADDSATPLFTSDLPAHKIVSHLQYHIANVLAESITLHSVFMEVLGIGVLITGRSGVGKSELALELISRNHRLVADDAPLFRRIAPDVLNGSCPHALSGFLEVRGLGVLNIRAMFGDSAIKVSKNLSLIIHLRNMDESELAQMDRLQGSRQTQIVLETDVPQVTLPILPGHNLAVLAEGAVRNHILMLKGYNAAQAFIERQQRLISQSES